MPTVDLRTNEIINNGLRWIAEEMDSAVVRSSFSTMIQESADAAAAILDAQGRLVSGGTMTLLMHSSSLRCGLRSVIEDYPLATMRPGDVYAMNDPFRGGIHSNDVLILKPVFVEGAPRYFTGTLVHVADLGGASSGGLPANVTDFFGEGLLLPPVPLYLAGEEHAAVFKVLSHNTRMPVNLLGDIRALVSGANVGADRLADLIGRFGPDAFAEAVEHRLASSKQRMTRALEGLPAGTYRGSFPIDDDGSGQGGDYQVSLEVTVGGGTAHVDFSGTSGQAHGIINAAYSQAIAATMFGIYAVTGLDLPVDEGTFEPVTVHLPKGSLVNPYAPAACNGRIVTCTAIIESMLAAFSQADERLASAASGIVHLFTMAGGGHRGDDAAGGGERPSGHRAAGGHWGFLDVEMGGSGARHGIDGADAMTAVMFGGGRTTTDVEPIEARFPVLFERSSLLPDSGGPGRWRGGMGTETIARILDEGSVTVRADRVRLAPPGLAGGLPGRTGSYHITRSDGTVEPLPGKSMNVTLGPGDTVTMRTTGGGGVGPPSERDREALARDVRGGLVSAASAAADYGVAGLDDTAPTDTAPTRTAPAGGTAPAGTTDDGGTHRG